MIRTFLPAIIGLVTILGFSVYEGVAIKDRWVVAGGEAKELAKRFDQVPMTLGDGKWVGQDMPVGEVERNGAGAIGYVSRRYTHSVTGRAVDIWLIVGHSRDITRHTPTACYPSAGFRQASSQIIHDIDLKNGNTAHLYTAKFDKEDTSGQNTLRVFWTFNHPDKDLWEAPGEGEGMFKGWFKGPRWHYGRSQALYKLYFTSSVLPSEDTITDNASVEFAKLMLPEIDKALFPTEGMAAESAEVEVQATDETL